MSEKNKRTKHLLLGLLLIAFVCLCACSSEKSSMDNGTIVSTNEQTNAQNDFVIEKADKVMREYLKYYNKDFSIIENKGIKDRYVRYEIVDSEKYIFCVAIDENFNIYGGFLDSGMDLLWKDGAPAEMQDEIGNESSFVEYSIDVIGTSFQSYRNRNGGTYVDVSNNKDSLSVVAMNKIEGTIYYLNIDDNSIVAVKDEKIVSIAYNLRSMNTTSSDLTIRKVLDSEKMAKFFDVYPQENRINDYSTIYYWQVLNGYFGIIGSDYSKDVYGNIAWYVVVYSDKEYCSVL